MEFEFSKRLDAVDEGIFAILNKKKEELVAAGKTVYNFSVGTPDFPPEKHVMTALLGSPSYS